MFPAWRFTGNDVAQFRKRAALNMRLLE